MNAFETSPEYAKIVEQYQLIKDRYIASMADGSLSFTDAFGLLAAGVNAAVVLFKPYSELPYHKRKELGVKLSQEFYDDVIAPLDLKFVPNIIEPLVDRALSSVVPSLVDALYEAIHHIRNDSPRIIGKEFSMP